MRQQRPNVLALMAVVGTLVLAGCSGNPALSDRVVENKGAEAFLDRIEKNCGSLYVGSNQIRDLLGVSSDDTYFIDATSKLYFGKVDKQGYAGDINAFYPADRNKKALDCIFQQLDN